MEKIIISICASKDHFAAYSVNCYGIYGAGDSVELAIQDAKEAISLIKSELPKEQWPPQLKGEYEIEYKYDVQSILSHYQNIFTKAALERLTGINQKQLHHYASGLKKPREAQRQKIEQALHNLGQQLLAVHL